MTIRPSREHGYSRPDLYHILQALIIGAALVCLAACAVIVLGRV